MGTVGGIIGIPLPERHKPGPGAFDTRPRAVGAWLDDLPMANVGETARRIYEAVKEVNRLQLSRGERFQFLERLPGAVDHVQEVLQKHYLDQIFPLSDKAVKVAIFIRALRSELALGYVSAAEEMLASSFFRRDKRALCTMFQSALYHYSVSMLVCYQTYAPPPRGLWSNVHHIYQAAEAKGLHRTSARWEGRLQPKLTLETLYKQILLLSLASPFRLRRGETECVHRLLEIWAPLAKLRPYPKEGNPQGLFVVHLLRDEEPRYLAPQGDVCTTEHCRVLDTDALTGVVREEMEREEAAKGKTLRQRLGTKALTPELLRRLAMVWGLPLERQHPRTAAEGEVETVNGLTALHRTLAGQDPIGRPALFAGQARFQSRPTHSEQKPRDVWNLYERGEPFEAVSDDAQNQHPAVAAESQTWRLKDRSEGGYCLLCRDPNSAGAHVGGLMGLREGADDWCIGVVRWLKHPAHHTLEVGIQLLAPRAAPLAVRRTDMEAGFQRALLLKGPKTGNMLLLPPLLFRLGDRLELRTDAREHRVALTKLIEDTASFAQFQFESLDADVRPPSSARGESSDFSGLWSQI
jgi:hypothetical protein